MDDATANIGPTVDDLSLRQFLPATEFRREMGSSAARPHRRRCQQIEVHSIGASQVLEYPKQTLRRDIAVEPRVDVRLELAEPGGHQID